jgi:hypothetical protein
VKMIFKPMRRAAYYACTGQRHSLPAASLSVNRTQGGPMLPSTSDYSPKDRRVDVSFPAQAPSLSLSNITAPTKRAGSGDAKWAKGYSQGAELGRQMASARGLNVSQEQGEQ